MKTQTQSLTTTAGSIIEEIRAAIPPANRGSRPWHERVPAEHAETLREIHDAWHDGLFGSRRYPAAAAISKRLSDLGIDIGEQGVIAWLRLPRS